MADDFFSTLYHLSSRFNVSNLSLLPRYFHCKCSDDLHFSMARVQTFTGKSRRTTATCLSHTRSPCIPLIRRIDTLLNRLIYLVLAIEKNLSESKFLPFFIIVEYSCVKFLSLLQCRLKNLKLRSVSLIMGVISSQFLTNPWKIFLVNCTLKMLRKGIPFYKNEVISSAF